MQRSDKKEVQGNVKRISPVKNNFYNSLYIYDEELCEVLLKTNNILATYI